MKNKVDIAVVRMLRNGWHRAEIGTWMAEIAEVQLAHDSPLFGKIDTIVHLPIQREPVELGRNIAVKTAQDRKIDYLFMIDDDMGPARGFFQYAMELFLNNREKPYVIGTPARGGPETGEQMCVFKFEDSIQKTTDATARVLHKSVAFSNKEAATATGLVRVANIGAGVIAYDVRVFSKIRTPYFVNQFNQDHTEIVDSEECYCHRLLNNIGVPIFCAFDYWSTHYKIKRVVRPEL